jgi:hypothetical protein
MKQISKPQHIVFALESWNEWRIEFEKAAQHYESLKDEDLDDASRRKKAIAKCRIAMLRFLEEEGVIGIVEKIRPVSTAKSGPKLKWSDEKLLSAWLRVEREFRAARRRDSSIKTVSGFTKSRTFRKLLPLTVHITVRSRPVEKPDGSFTSTDDLPEFTVVETAGHALRLHSAGQKILRENPHLKAKWEKLADGGVKAKSKVARNSPR